MKQVFYHNKQHMCLKEGFSIPLYSFPDVSGHRDINDLINDLFHRCASESALSYHTTAVLLTLMQRQAETHCRSAGVSVKVKWQRQSMSWV